ncbi:MAG TPA: hypothetical protein PLD20_21585 [Blastocatellia bacterium]|nr:hypothetical protein [Blastocatellia bacterium]HMX30163.1 hypothetical protein [Blastocatellia bacterium]HMY71694.1 hypothetical protein [Blastocatellia bacterium]HMZ20545.1 hypothetical protein [Blastocatellia bacterium]HNG32868.1 hypothetical protein [Blastocatellia bacterium]
MKKIGINLMALAICCAVAAVSLVQAKDRKKTVTFTEDFLVNSKLVKKGLYEVKFDAETSQVTILQDGDVVVTAKAEVRLTDKKALYNSASFTSTDRGKALTGITFEGDKRMILLNERTESADQ